MEADDYGVARVSVFEFFKDVPESDKSLDFNPSELGPIPDDLDSLLSSTQPRRRKEGSAAGRGFAGVDVADFFYDVPESDMPLSDSILLGPIPGNLDGLCWQTRPRSSVAAVITGRINGLELMGLQALVGWSRTKKRGRRVPRTKYQINNNNNNHNNNTAVPETKFKRNCNRKAGKRDCRKKETIRGRVGSKPPRLVVTLKVR